MQTKINTMIIATFVCHCNTNSIIQSHKRLDMVLGRVEQTALSVLSQDSPHQSDKFLQGSLCSQFHIISLPAAGVFYTLYLPLSCVGTDFLFFISAFINFLIGSLPQQAQSRSQLLLFPHLLHFGRKQTHKCVLLL